MRYCVNYFEKFNYLNEIEEINILFEKDEKPIVENLKTLIGMEKVNPKATFNIFMSAQDCANLTEDELNVFVMDVVNYNQEDNNSMIKIVFEGSLLEEDYSEALYNVFPKIQDNDIPFFFDSFAKDWDMVLGLLSLGVSDIYISGQIGFCLHLLKDILENEDMEDVQIRAVCNAAQASFLYKEQDNFKAFFIRPEDVEFYGQYIDVLEFNNFSKSINTTYEIYKRGTWDADLEILIDRLNISVDNRNLVQPAMQERATCQRKCLTGERSCHICDEAIAYADLLDEKNVYLTEYMEDDEQEENTDGEAL